MHFDRLKRRQFITLIGGAAAWPLAARAQQPDHMRRIGVLMILAADDTESSARVAALTQALQQLGWMAGRNVQVEYRWGADSGGQARAVAAELVALAPDVILLCPMSSLEHATARPLHETPCEGCECDDRATVGASLETSVNKLLFAGSRMSVVRLGLSRSEVGRRSFDRPQG
jgi:hypothetical protein